MHVMSDELHVIKIILHESTISQFNLVYTVCLGTIHPVAFGLKFCYNDHRAPNTSLHLSHCEDVKVWRTTSQTEMYCERR